MAGARTSKRYPTRLNEFASVSRAHLVTVGHSAVRLMFCMSINGITLAVASHCPTVIRCRHFKGATAACTAGGRRAASWQLTLILTLMRAWLLEPITAWPERWLAGHLNQSALSGRGLSGGWQAWGRGLDSSGPIRIYIVQLSITTYCRWLEATYHRQLVKYPERTSSRRSLIKRLISGELGRLKACIPETGRNFEHLLYCFGIALFFHAFRYHDLINVRDNNDGVQAYMT